MTDQTLLIFVTESDSISRSDEKYLSRYLYIHHGKEMQSNKYIVKYVYMGGKYKYQSKTVVNEINSFKRLAKSRGIDVEVIYCFDTDRLNNDDRRLLQEAEQYVKDNGYRIVLFNPEIEPVFGIKDYHNKAEAATRFCLKKNSKDSLDISKFLTPYNEVLNKKDSSNLEIVLREVFGEK